MNSLIITVKNEINNLPAWLRSIKEQSFLPDEIIVVDGWSNDGTWEWLQNEALTNKILKVFRETGNIAHGRNFAIRKSAGNIIVVTDAGCIYSKDWFAAIIKPFEDKKVVWSATAFAPWFEESDSTLVYAIASSTTPADKEFHKNWRPSSRSVAFYKDRWQTVGGYPEWIPFCEDVLFDLKLLRKDGQPFFIREPKVFWRPRLNLKSYLRQLYNYTLSEGHGKINTLRQFIRYTVYIFSVVCLFLSFAMSPLYLIPLLAGLILYMLKFWRRWFEFTAQKNTALRFGGIILVPLVVALGDIAKMSGYVVGTLERLVSDSEVEYY